MKKKVLPYITMLSPFIPPPAMNEAHSVERRKDLQDSYSKSDTINSVYNFNNVAVRTEYIQDKWSYFITHLVGEEALDIRHFCFRNPNHLAVQEVLHCLQPLSLPFSTGSIHNVSLIYPLFHYLAFWKIYTNRKKNKIKKSFVLSINKIMYQDPFSFSESAVAWNKTTELPWHKEQWFCCRYK